ncbi:MAG: HAMP domain-containing histidine kinase [Kofleriaceae bacterium]|nr:HAMP domain-containing histidine kinase [Kofleriaceae bacterium]MBP6838429.1 HAMP domain-containing histidine kinase [Kofleriaceae bacterium]
MRGEGGKSQQVALAELAGAVAAELVLDLAAPVSGARDRLALVIDHLDRHVAASTGPTPYPWKALGGLRQDLASAYFEATTAARRIEDLRAALIGLGAPPSPTAVGEVVEIGVHLASHRIGDKVELLVDLGVTPPARAERGALALVVARAVLVSAHSAAAAPGSALSVRTRAEADAVVISIGDNGAGVGDGAVVEAMAVVVDSWGGRVDAAITTDVGCVFEIRLATAS